MSWHFLLDKSIEMSISAGIISSWTGNDRNTFFRAYRTGMGQPELWEGYEMDEMRHLSLSDEEHAVEGLRALARIIARAVLDELPPVQVEEPEREVLQPNAQATSQPPVKHGLVSAQTLSDILGVPRSSIWRLAREGTIPCIRIGRSLRFDREAVMKALNASSEN
jgi:excisionase family DNA binding protein